MLFIIVAINRSFYSCATTIFESKTRRGILLNVKVEKFEFFHANFPVEIDLMEVRWWNGFCCGVDSPTINYHATAASNAMSNEAL